MVLKLYLLTKCSIHCKIWATVVKGNELRCREWETVPKETRMLCAVNTMPSWRSNSSVWLKSEGFLSCCPSVSHFWVPKEILCLCLTFLSSVFWLFFCCFYSLYSLFFWPYFSHYCLSDPTFPYYLLLYSLYSLLFWPYFSSYCLSDPTFSFSSAALLSLFSTFLTHLFLFFCCGSKS